MPIGHRVSGADDLDLVPLRRAHARARRPLRDRRAVRAPVEEDEPAPNDAEAREVGAELSETLLDGIRTAIAPNFELEAETLRPVREMQIHSAAPDSVLALDGASAVHHPVEECHQHEVGGDLVVERSAEQRLSVLAPEVEEGFEEAVEVEAPISPQPGGSDGEERGARRKGELPDDDLSIDRV